VIGVTGAGNNIAINGNTSFSGNGSLTLSTANGSIGGSSRLSAGGLVIAAPTGSIALDTNLATLTASANGSIAINDSGAVELVTVVSNSGDVSVTAAGNLTVGTAVEATTGSVTLTGSALAFTGTTTAATDLSLNATGGGLNLAIATLTFGGNFSADAAGALTQNGVLAVTGTTSLSAGSGITLGEANTFAQPVAITATGAVSLNVAGPIALADSTITGSLALTAAGAITDSGNLSVSGLTVLDAGSTNDITLDGDNDFTSTVAITSAGNVTLNDTNGFILGSSDISGNLSVTANGTITDAGGSTVGGTTTLNAGANAITLDGGNDFVGPVTIVSATNATLNDTNSLDLAASTLAGNLSLTAANDITQSGILTVGGTTTLAAGAAGDVTLSLANVFTGSVGVTRANDVTLNDSGPLAIGASTIAGNLSATANGTITDSGAIAVTGVTTLTATANGSITLDEANDFGGPVNAQTGGSVYLNDTGSIELGTVSAASLAVDANGSITASGVLTIQGDADFYSYSGGDITLDEANDFGAGGSGRLQILKGGNVTLNDIDSLAIGRIVASGNLDLSQASLGLRISR